MSNTSQPDMEMMPIGHYELLECIGRGGMGLVYLARDTRLGRMVAIKCLRAELYEPSYRDRFRREAMLLAKLNHTNIVQIYDYIETDDRLALVMEYVDGQNLQTWLREHVVPLKTRLQWLSKIAEGLAVAHDAGIIHRDLKAENILINRRQDIKISDLGIARSVDSNLTINEYVAGSYCSMSPEQAMGEELDFRSDLFSLGILAYQLLCGSHPFGETDNKLQLMQRIISHPPIPPQQVNPVLSSPLCKFLLQLLSKNPDNRPSSTRDLATSFAAFSNAHAEIDTGDDTELLVEPLRQMLPSMDTSSAKLPVMGKDIAWWHSKRLAAAGLLTIAVIVALVISAWPEPTPRYLAVVQPVISASGLPNERQELVQGAVYDALRQSAVQLKGFYLIPSGQTEDAGGDYETIHKATGADELLTADIRCQLESCTINISRLAASGSDEGQTRLRVLNTRQVNVLSDQYLAIADIVQSGVGHFFSQKMVNGFEGISEDEYKQFIDVSHALRVSGASDQLLEKMDNIYPAVNRIAALRGLYTQIAVDLYYETSNRQYLNKLKRLYRSNAFTTNDAAYLYDLFSVQIAENKFSDATETLQRLKRLDINRIRIHELEAELFHSENDFPGAIATYEKLLKLKASAHNHYNLSLAHWYAGNNDSARRALEHAINLSPHFFKAHRLYGAIALIEGDPQQAIRSYASILEKKADDISSISNIGIGHLLHGDYREAAERFDQAVQMAPYNSTYWLNQADAESLSGNRETANALYQRVLSLADDNNNRDHLRNRVQAYAHLGQYQEAIQSLQLLQRADPHNIDTHYTSAMVYTLAGDYVSALVNIENALTNNLSKIWFKFSWFDPLCHLPQFSSLLNQPGALQRCEQFLPD